MLKTRQSNSQADCSTVSVSKSLNGLAALFPRGPPSEQADVNSVIVTIHMRDDLIAAFYLLGLLIGTTACGDA